MAKIIRHGLVYEEISLTMFSEREVQDAISSRADLIFPGYYYCPFSATISVEDDSAQPDFVLIEKEYRIWYIGEVEMVRHSLTGHVLRQVRIFLRGDYNEKHVDHILNKRPDLDAGRLQLLIDNVQPTVLVMADKLDDVWKSVIREEGAKLAVFEMFRHGQADLIFRVNGDTPETLGRIISLCQLDRSLPRLLLLETPSGVPAVNGQRIELEYEGIISECVYMIGEGKGWLNPVGHLNLPQNARFALSLVGNNRLRMEVFNATQRRHRGD